MFKIIAMVTAAVMAASPLAAQQVAKPVPVTPDIASKQIKSTASSGQEARLAAFNLVYTDCSFGPVPDYRLVTKPAKGTVRVEPVKIALNRPSDNRRAHCNGREVDALGLYYKSPEGFTGVERVVIDLDWRNGGVERVVYTVTVR